MWSCHGMTNNSPQGLSISLRRVTCPKHAHFRGSKQSLDAWRKSVECPTFSSDSLLKLAVSPTTVITPGCIISNWANASAQRVKPKGKRMVLDLYHTSSQDRNSFPSGPRPGVPFTPGSMRFPVPSRGWASTPVYSVWPWPGALSCPPGWATASRGCSWHQRPWGHGIQHSGCFGHQGL